MCLRGKVWLCQASLRLGTVWERYDTFDLCIVLFTQSGQVMQTPLHVSCTPQSVLCYWCEALHVRAAVTGGRGGEGEVYTLYYKTTIIESM